MVEKKLKHFCKRIFHLQLLILLCSSCSSVKEDHVSVFVASSLSHALVNVELACDSVNLMLNTASSGMLARQILAGANCDLYFSANRKWIKALINEGLVDSTSVEVVAMNSLVLIYPLKQNSVVSNDILLSESLLNKERIVIGDPGHVPVGEYAKQCLLNLGIYDTILPKLMECRDVLATLRMVELGEVDAGIVYKTVAMESKKAEIACEIPDSLHMPISYYVVALSKAGNNLLNDDKFTIMLRSELNSLGFKIE